VTEAGEKSGTLHTANFALDQGKTVLAVPWNITTAQSKGTNALIRAGALPVTAVEDIFHELGVHEDLKQFEILADNDKEKCILDLL
jgi:DNA processing protein